MRRWTLRCWTRDPKKDWIYAAQYVFTSDAETIDQAYQAAYDAGFACLRRVDDRIVANAQLSIKLSSQTLGELLVEIADEALKIP